MFVKGTPTPTEENNSTLTPWGKDTNNLNFLENLFSSAYRN